ncbi:MAG TPA: DsbA family protein [Baekduia sp.]
MEHPRPEQLTVVIDPERDHVQGSATAPFTLVEYGDFECPFSAKAAVRVHRLQRELGDRLRFVYRQFPLSKHPHAQLAAEASEAAAAQDRFWNMYAMLFTHQARLERDDLVGYAARLGMDVERFARELDDHTWEEKVRLQAEGGRLLGATGTPSFVIDGRLYTGPYEPADLRAALGADG